jgi:hypothetical protein
MAFLERDLPALIPGFLFGDKRAGLDGGCSRPHPPLFGGKGTEYSANRSTYRTNPGGSLAPSYALYGTVLCSVYSTVCTNMYGTCMLVETIQQMPQDKVR